MKNRYPWELDIVIAIVTSVGTNVKTSACGSYEIRVQGMWKFTFQERKH